MALPPNPEVNETFLREVDEDLRRDRVRDFFVNNRIALIVALILFIAASGGFIWWQEHQRRQAGKEVEELSTIYRDIAASTAAPVGPKLDALADSSSEAVRASALFTRAALAIEQRDLPLASKTYGQVIADTSLPQPYRDAALLRQTTVDFDKLKPEEVVTRLAPLAKPDNAFYGSAAELTAVALIKQGKTAEAGRMFAAIAANKDLPETLRARSVQLAGTLGVDASGAMDPVAP